MLNWTVVPARKWATTLFEIPSLIYFQLKERVHRHTFRCQEKVPVRWAKAYYKKSTQREETLVKFCSVVAI